MRLIARKGKFMRVSDRDSVRTEKNRTEDIRSTSVRCAGDRVDLGNVAARKLHHGSGPLIDCMRTNQNFDSSGLGLR